MKKERCEMCHAGMPLCEDAEVDKALSTLTEWVYDRDAKRIYKLYNFKGYYAAIAFVNAVAWIAHQQKHHPDMQVSYNKVEVSYQTHEAGGVTKNDLLCARLVEEL